MGVIPISGYAHLLRDLAAFHRADPDRQVWAKAMAPAAAPC